MDHIIQALERAKVEAGPRPTPPDTPTTPRSVGPSEPLSHPRAVRLPPTLASARTAMPTAPIREVELSASHLEANRIVAHDVAHQQTKSFDMLRTQVLQTMGANGWRVLAVTSPTAGCGKTFTAINLALSTARQPESSVMLVDMDLQKPQVAQRLGIECVAGLRAVLEGRTELPKAMLHASIEGIGIRALPTERPSSRSSDWMASQAVNSLIEELRAQSDVKLIILDLPPMLAGDDVISILPQVDCVLLVAAAGTTTKVELKECSKFLKTTPLVRMVLNKVPEPALAYY